jgi:hypothetical protein
MTRLFKLIWNQKSSYFAIFIEQALIACVLMFCSVRSAKNMQKYAEPGILDTHNTFMLVTEYIWESGEQSANIRKNTRIIAENLRKSTYAEAITASFELLPYSRNHSNWIDTLLIDGKKIKTEIMGSDEYGINVFSPVVEEGEWLINKPLNDRSVPVVITRQLADNAGWVSSVGKKIQFDSYTCTVVGVIEGVKLNPLTPSVATLILPVYTIEDFGCIYVVKVKDNEKGNFANAFFKETQKIFSGFQNLNIVLMPVEELKQDRLFSALFDLVMVGIPTLFLSIFAFIGIFGLFQLHTKKHFREFALRIAIGATKKRLMALVISESLLVTGLALIPALILSFFLYDYASIADLTAILATIGVMLLFSFISAWYPAWKVSRVNPAEALQYE